VLVLDEGRLLFDDQGVPAGWTPRKLADWPAGGSSPESPEPLAAPRGSMPSAVPWTWEPRQTDVELEARDLTTAIGGRELLSCVDLAVGPSTFVALAGRSGSGKTTLLMTLAGLVPPAAGTVSTSHGSAGDCVTYVPQFPEQLFWRATIAAELASFGRSAVRFAATNGETEPADLRALGLPSGTAQRSPFRLSGGERRRVALACALRAARPVLLLDEPSAGLDRPGFERLLALIAVVRRSGGSVVAATHDPALMRQADNVWRIEGATVVAD
jgi:energy-coupling factor transport system ATP-binding protein